MREHTTVPIGANAGVTDPEKMKQPPRRPMTPELEAQLDARDQAKAQAKADSEAEAAREAEIVKMIGTDKPGEMFAAFMKANAEREAGDSTEYDRIKGELDRIDRDHPKPRREARS